MVVGGGGMTSVGTDGDDCGVVGTYIGSIRI